MTADKGHGPVLNLDEIGTLDRQVEQLFDFKPIPEHEVKVLCDKVSKDHLDGEGREPEPSRRNFSDTVELFFFMF